MTSRMKPYEDPASTNWALPVAGMKSAPGDYASGEGNWARGSFGYKKPASKGGKTHEGVDIYAERGNSIVSPVAGTVTSAGFNNTSGYYVKIKGTDGIEYFYAHMNEASPWDQGSQVQSGIHIGTVGNSGNASGTSTHLHFGMRKNGKSISPNEFLETGKQSKQTPLSAIPGLNTPEEIAAWAQEELKNQSAAAQANADMQGFDFAQIPGQIQDLQTPLNEGFGQQFLGATINAFSNAQMGGAGRVPIPSVSTAPNVSSAMDATGANVGVDPSGVPVAEAVNPALQREPSNDDNQRT